MVYSSEHISDDEAAAQLKDALDGEPLADPRLIRFRIGKRRRIFEKNVVAVGLSSGFLEPLESTSIHLIQSMLLKLVNFFPDRRFAPADADAFNQQADFEYERIRDFIIAHYKLTERDDTPFWRANRAVRVPDTLKAKLDLFAASGRVFRENEELFAEESWIQVLIGQGLVPHGYDAAVDIKGEDEIFGYLDNVRKVISACVETLPDHADYIRRNCKADIAL
jgi:tryptophan halogenase